MRNNKSSLPGLTVGISRDMQVFVVPIRINDSLCNYYRVVGTSVEDADAVSMGRNVTHFAATVTRNMIIKTVCLNA